MEAVGWDVLVRCGQWRLCAGKKCCQSGVPCESWEGLAPSGVLGSLCEGDNASIQAVHTVGVTCVVPFAFRLSTWWAYGSLGLLQKLYRPTTGWKRYMASSNAGIGAAVDICEKWCTIDTICVFWSIYALCELAAVVYENETHWLICTLSMHDAWKLQIHQKYIADQGFREVLAGSSIILIR